MDLDDVWVSENTVKYKKNVKFESSYLEVVASRTQDLDYIWLLVAQNKCGSYNFDRNFENRVIENMGVIQSYSELWDYVSESCSFDEFCSEVNFENEINNEYFVKAYNYFSGMQGNLK